MVTVVKRTEGSGESFAEQCAVFGSGGIGRIVRLRRDYRFFRFHIRSFHFGTSSESEAACSDSNQKQHVTFSC